MGGCAPRQKAALHDPLFCPSPIDREKERGFTMPSIVTLTMNPAIDTSSTVDHVVPEHKLRRQAPRYDPGGGGLNVSRAIQKLGGSSLALYPAGGPTGQILRDLLDQEGLTHQLIPITGWMRENFTILEEASGQQYRFGMPGPTFHEAEWRQCLEVVADCAPPPDYLVGSGSLPPGIPDHFYAQLVRAVRDHGVRVVVDTSGAALRAAVQEGVYLIKPNLRELAQLAGSDLADETQQEAAAMTFVQEGRCEIVVVSLGAAGALLVHKEGCERIRSPTVPIQSKVGAGDSMTAGLVLSLARGLPIREAVRFGVAAGAAAVMTPGTELCRREDTERLFARMHPVSIAQEQV